MVDVAVVILRVVAEIHDVAEGINENHRQARRLLKRAMAIETPVLAVHNGTILSSSESLRQLSATVENIRNFLEGYARTTKLNRALKRKSNAAKFTQLGVNLTEGMHALQLDVAVDAWANEDASDRLEDLENMVDMMEIMERNRTENHAEVMDVLKTLRNDERSELTGWIEIDYEQDLDFDGSTLLGSGGFGEVRTAKWNGADVAVKHLLASGIQRDCVRDLRKEIRLHSSLSFDFVAPLYAASTIAPHLCLVVELASGGSLQQYLHSASEPLAHALQTAFLYDVARGMAFLHVKGILHRDLKSANVLMFANGRLKLCDFGLSKVKTDLSSRSTRGAVGTTQWMSPEEMDESPANELTDVYSFGVLCFEVVTRTEPFKGKRPAHVIGAVLYRNERPHIPEEASASPDVVPLMEQCWRQDPVERPEGFGPVVRALASVVSRFGDPRNHNAAAADVTSSRGVKLGGTAPPTASSGVDAASGWSGAASQSTGADPWASPDQINQLPPAEPPSGRDDSTLEGGVARRAAKETVVPDSGKVYAPFAYLPIASTDLPPSGGGTSGQFKNPTKMFGQKLRTENKHAGKRRIPEPPLAGGKVYDLDDLAVAKDLCNQAVGLSQQGKYEEAEPLSERSLAICEKSLGPDHPDVATALNSRAILLMNQGKYEEAGPLLERSLAIREKSLGPNHPDVATALNNRGELLMSQGKYEEAGPLVERALAIREKSLGPIHPLVATALNSRANLLMNQGKYEEAGPLSKRSLAIREKCLGPIHPNVATALNTRAKLLTNQGKYEEAGPLVERSLAIREMSLGPDHPHVAIALNNQANLLMNQGKYMETGPLFERSLVILEKYLGPDHPHVATTLNYRANSLVDQGKYEEAGPLFERSLAIREKSLGPEHPDVATAFHDRAKLLMFQDKCTEAVPPLERALSIRTEKLGGNHQDTVNTRDFLERVREKV